MPGGMTFRKDCGECGRSFLTPDKKAKICQRCADKRLSRSRPVKGTGQGTSPQAAGEAKYPQERSPSSGPAVGPAAHAPAPEWEEDDSSAIVEIARREWKRIDLSPGF
jgi:hypothetical protein